MTNKLWTVWLFLVIAAMVFAQSPSKPNYRQIYVRDCAGKRFVDLYMDPEMTTHMTNPFTSRADGGYTFYVHANCVQVEVK